MVVSLAHDSDGRNIVGANYCRRPAAVSVEFDQGAHTPLHVVITDDDQVGGEPDFHHGRPERLPSGYCRFQMHWAAYERDASMPKGREVLHGLSNPLEVIDADVDDSLGIRSNVDNDPRDLAQAQNGGSIDAAFNHWPHRRFNTCGIMHGRSEQDLVGVLDGEVLEGLNNF